MKLSMFKSLFKSFKDSDVNRVEPKTEGRIVKQKKFGKVVYETAPGVTNEIDFILLFDIPPEESNAIFATFVDGSVAIGLTVEYFSKVSLGRLMGVIAHELGHHLCDHNSKEHVNVLNLKSDKTERLQLLWENEKCRLRQAIYADQFYRTQLSAIIQGAVLVRELEADLKALEYVPVDHLIAAHSEDLNNKYISSYSRQEKINRISVLSKIPESENLLMLKLVIPKVKEDKSVVNLVYRINPI